MEWLQILPLFRKKTGAKHHNFSTPKTRVVRAMCPCCRSDPHTVEISERPDGGSNVIVHCSCGALNILRAVGVDTTNAKQLPHGELSSPLN